MFICTFSHHCSNGTLRSSDSVVTFAVLREVGKIYYSFFYLFFFLNIIVAGAQIDKIAVSF